MSCGSVKGGEEYLGLDGYRLKVMDGELEESWTTSKNGQRILESKSLRGVAKLVFWLVCLCFYNGVFREAFIDKDQKNVWPLRGDELESSFPGIFY